jgi:hypothetical protein
VKLGRKTVSRFDRRTPWLARYLDARAYSAPPPLDDWTGSPRVYSALGNDRIGNCTFAALGHMIQQRCALVNAPCLLTEGHVIDAYRAASNWNGVIGDPSDDGHTMIDALLYAKHVGIGPYKIESFVRVNVYDDVEMKAAIHAFTSVYVGANLPRSINRQGSFWSMPDASARTPDDQPGSLGGHAFLYTGQQRGKWTAMPWTTKTTIDDSWDLTCVDEGWIVLCPLLATAMRVAPNGFNYERLRADLNAIGA